MPIPFEDFTDHIDTIRLPLHWDGFAVIHEPIAAQHNLVSSLPNSHETRVPHDPLTAILPIPRNDEGRQTRVSTSSAAIEIGEAQYHNLAELLYHSQEATANFEIPSRQSLARYLTAYTLDFDPHLPFIHLQAHIRHIKI
ncbi:hypothetical protein BT63DRAFT_449617 [Microthyrium microscopicum]|uniref:Uncharacterized protein n=1 Tax=Microthyrium microscopicum TaxID=703497 RepID=A0A6A6UU99_9PEZI|nr:hypothetical protein BT63DRAFT_449617 [Microthyrium microscopicum]